MTERIAIAGSGSIGVAFAVLFAGSGFEVRLWDAYPEALERGKRDLDARLQGMSDAGLLPRSKAEAQANVTFHAKLEDTLAGAALVQECIPEKLDLKRALFSELEKHAPRQTIFSSATSAIPPSAIAEGMACADRIIVGHPGNPPYLIPVIEIVPSAETSDATVERARALYSDAGLKPVIVRKEVEGFIFNRLQGALLREAYCLVRDGVATVEDVDEVVRSGLGLRWSFMGPFETADLNTRGGIEAHAEKMGPAYRRMGQERGQDDAWTEDLVEKVTAERRAALSLDDWEERVRWRDQKLMTLRARSAETKR